MFLNLERRCGIMNNPVFFLFFGFFFFFFFGTGRRYYAVCRLPLTFSHLKSISRVHFYQGPPAARGARCAILVGGYRFFKLILVLRALYVSNYTIKMTMKHNET